MKRRLRLTKVCVSAGLALSLLCADSAYMTAAAAAASSSNANYFNDISGTVKDSQGNPLPGVTIVIKNTKKGVKTGADGKFVINANEGDVLVFSFVGFVSQEVSVSGNNNLNVVLQDNVKGLNELVVTALGIRKAERSVGYAVSKVSGGEFTKAREISVANALVGKVAGVNSTAPATGAGGSSRVTIRGNTSLNGDNQPLYVVNGMPLNNENMGNATKWGGSDLGDGISSINPDDIESMTVLKGGAAAALYGQRGRNGVILITTKGGKARKGLGVELNSNIMVDKINDFTDWQDQYGSGSRGIKPTNLDQARTNGLLSWGSKLDGSDVMLFNGQTGKYTAQSKDNLKDFYKTGVTYTNSIAFSGGNENTTFRLGLGDLRSSSVYPNSKYNRTNVNLSVGFKLSDKWSGDVNITYSKETGKNRPNLSDAPGNGNYGILFLPPNIKGSLLAPGYDAVGNEISASSDVYTTNPYFAANKFQNNTQKDRVLGVASLRYQALSWLYIQGRITNDFFAFNGTSITPTGTAYFPDGRIDLERNYQFNETNMDLLVGANKEIAKDLNLGVTLGGNLLKMQAKDNRLAASALAFRGLYSPATAGVLRSTQFQQPRKDVQSLYGSVELSYKSTFYVSITDRNDWSSTLPKGNNSYNYPSVNASYVFTEHIKPSFLDFGKIRAGYAMVGGDADVFKTQLYYNTFGAIGSAALGNLSNELPNPKLEPLKVKELEVGAELKFLNNRLGIDFTWYNKQTLNDIVAGTVSRASGFQTALVNVGKIDNKGIEVLVTGVPVRTKNFNWTTSVNFAHNKNTVVQLAEGQNFMLTGEARTENGYIQQRVGQTYAQIMAFDYKRDSKGTIVLDASGLPLQGDLISMGTGIQPTTGGWSNDISYKNLSLSFLIDFKSGGKIYSGTNARGYQNGLHKETLPGRDGGVTVKGVDEKGVAVEKNVNAQDYYNRLFQISSLYVYDASFIKFRSVSLTYSFPASAFNNKIQGLSLSLVGRNLFYFKKNTPNIDPEANYTNTNAQGLEYGGLPSTRSFGVNLNVKF